MLQYALLPSINWFSFQVITHYMHRLSWHQRKSLYVTCVLIWKITLKTINKQANKSASYNNGQKYVTREGIGYRDDCTFLLETVSRRRKINLKLLIVCWESGRDLKMNNLARASSDKKHYQILTALLSDLQTSAGISENKAYQLPPLIVSLNKNGCYIKSF